MNKAQLSVLPSPEWPLASNTHKVIQSEAARSSWDRARLFVWRFAKPALIQDREDEGEVFSVWYKGYQHADHDIKDLVQSLAEVMSAE